MRTRGTVQRTNTARKTRKYALSTVMVIPNEAVTTCKMGFVSLTPNTLANKFREWGNPNHPSTKLQTAGQKGLG